MTDQLDLEEIANLFDSRESFSQLAEYMELQQNYSAAIREVSTKLEILASEFKMKYDHSPIHRIESRLKSPRSAANKLKKLGFDVSVRSARDNLFDIAGIRVISGYIEDIYAVADMLTSQSDISVIRIKDYIKNPKPNGYRSLHLVISVPVFLSDGEHDLPVEVQIRTVAMDFWASLEHELRYKTNNSIPEDANAELLYCANAINDLDIRMERLFKETNGSKQ